MHPPHLLLTFIRVMDILDTEHLLPTDLSLLTLPLTLHSDLWPMSPSVAVVTLCSSPDEGACIASDTMAIIFDSRLLDTLIYSHLSSHGAEDMVPSIGATGKTSLTCPPATFTVQLPAKFSTTPALHQCQQQGRPKITRWQIVSNQS